MIGAPLDRHGEEGGDREDGDGADEEAIRRVVAGLEADLDDLVHVDEQLIQLGRILEWRKADETLT